MDDIKNISWKKTFSGDSPGGRFLFLCGAFRGGEHLQTEKIGMWILCYITIKLACTNKLKLDISNRPEC